MHGEQEIFQRSAVPPIRLERTLKTWNSIRGSPLLLIDDAKVIQCKRVSGIAGNKCFEVVKRL
jgi:hypothetical protein